MGPDAGWVCRRIADPVSNDVLKRNACVNDSQFVEDLVSRYKAGEPLEYVFFWGHQASKKGVTAACFSQWYLAPFEVEGQRYVSAEHYMMAEKAALFGDQETRARIIEASDPNAAKALGRQVRGFDEALWVRERFGIDRTGAIVSRGSASADPALHLVQADVVGVV